jgi:hypothetical protein
MAPDSRISRQQQGTPSADCGLPCYREGQPEDVQQWMSGNARILDKIADRGQPQQGSAL